MRRLGFVVAALLIAGSALGAYSLKPIWSVAAGDRAYLSPTDNNARGMAYNPVTGNLLVVSRTGAPNVYVLDGATGADVGTLDMTGVTGGTFPINMIGAADDGAIYAGNLTLDGSGVSVFKLYRWANESAVPTVAFSGDPGSGQADRWGDSLDVRGAGLATQVLLGSNGFGGSPATNVAWFATADGVNFTPTTVGAPVPASTFRLGLTFGAGDTAYGKNTSADLTQIDLTSGAVLGTDTNLAASIVALDWDPGTGFLAGLHYSGPAGVYVYDIDPLGSAVKIAEGLLPTDNANVNGTGQPKWGTSNMLYVLGTNNGVAAFELVPEPGTMLLALAGAGLFLRRRRS